MSIFDLFDDNFVNIFWIAISGFIINTLVSQKLLLFNNPDRDIIRIITFGCVNLIFGETVKKIFTIIIKDNNVNWLNGLFPFIFNILIPILVISPSIIIVYEHIKYSEVFNFFGLDPVSKSDVWTILANEMKQNKHVSITLKNGKKINGFFDKKSFVSFLNDKDRSVYLSCVYDKENNNIVGRSIYVNGEEISHIALHDKDENQEMNKNQKKKRWN